jgi:hypothetical protein
LIISYSIGVTDLLTTIESKLISLAIESNSWANILAKVILKKLKYYEIYSIF